MDGQLPPLPGTCRKERRGRPGCRARSCVAGSVSLKRRETPSDGTFDPSGAARLPAGRRACAGFIGFDRHRETGVTRACSRGAPRRTRRHCELTGASRCPAWSRAGSGPPPSPPWARAVVLEVAHRAAIPPGSSRWSCPSVGDQHGAAFRRGHDGVGLDLPAASPGAR